ncbi:hypothetical protein [Nocardioides alcanivorans]|uniref:hypothetical protein n=1 Tax=Nocardioides alcanivorans TaxID=2897352 RepID=UPI001F1FC174|nr:hypothetical protein [Nocardioides alcanivorans]
MNKGVHVNALMNAPGVRKLLVIPAVGVAALAVVVSANWGQQAASGAGDGDGDGKFAVLGDGSLPTAKPELGAPRAPLSAEETGYAIHLATTDASIPKGATNVKGEPGMEFLYADLPEDIDSTGRQVVVNLYDYTANRGYQQVVDLVGGAVIASQSSAGLQVPTSTDEADVAMQVALAETGEGAAFKQEFEAAQGVPLLSPTRLSTSPEPSSSTAPPPRGRSAARTAAPS